MHIIAKIQTFMRRDLILAGFEFLYGTDLKMDKYNWNFVGKKFKII
jgi:hypothetical protein